MDTDKPLRGYWKAGFVCLGFVTVLSFGAMKVISDTRQTPMMPELEFPRFA